MAKGSVVADLGVGSRVVAVCRKSRLLRAAEKGLQLEISGSLPGRQPGRDAARLTRTAQDEAGIPEIEGHSQEGDEVMKEIAVVARRP